MPTAPRMNFVQHQVLKQIVREAPVINGFSYPFLRLLVDKAREMARSGELTTRRTDGRGIECDFLTEKGAVFLDQVSRQIGGGWENFGWEMGQVVVPEQIHGMLGSAETLLAICE